MFRKQFIGLDTAGNGINIIASSNTPGENEMFQIVRNSDDLSRVRIKAPNGFFLQVSIIFWFFFHMVRICHLGGICQ